MPPDWQRDTQSPRKCSDTDTAPGHHQSRGWERGALLLFQVTSINLVTQQSRSLPCIPVRMLWDLLSTLRKGCRIKVYLLQPSKPRGMDFKVLPDDFLPCFYLDPFSF